jgi:hypothetical protein
MKFWVDMGEDPAPKKPAVKLDNRESMERKQDLAVPKPKSETNTNKQIETTSGKNNALNKIGTNKKSTKEDKIMSHDAFTEDKKALQSRDTRKEIPSKKGEKDKEIDEPEKKTVKMKGASKGSDKLPNEKKITDGKETKVSCYNRRITVASLMGYHRNPVQPILRKFEPSPQQRKSFPCEVKKRILRIKSRKAPSRSSFRPWGRIVLLERRIPKELQTSNQKATKRLLQRQTDQTLILFLKKRRPKKVGEKNWQQLVSPTFLRMEVR